MKDFREIQTIFLDNMSHELRTPITVILGYAGILYEEIDDPDLKEMAEIILKSSNRLTESLNLLLDQSDIAANRLEVEFHEKDMNLLISDVANVYKPVAEDKNLELICNNSDEQLICKIDPKMFEKIISNLINNAMKFTPKGSITLGVSSEGDKVKIVVSDTGIGISEDKQTLIFEAFRQVSEGMNRLYQGTGLGLSVTKKFIELMNGNISVKSELEKGTTFTILFPKV